MLSAEISPLTRWQPTATAPWNRRRVWHLHRRAGFGATWQELQRDLADGPEVSIDRIVAQLQTDAAADDFEQMSKVICDAAVASNNINRLKAWWIYRMLNSPDPLRERLTMMWHNHFATSNAKVEDVGMMRQQNDTLRRLATGNFGDLLRAMANDPALQLSWSGWMPTLTARNIRTKTSPAKSWKFSADMFAVEIGNFQATAARRCYTVCVPREVLPIQLAPTHENTSLHLHDSSSAVESGGGVSKESL